MSATIKRALPGETDVDRLAEVINLAYRGQGGWTTEVKPVSSHAVDNSLTPFLQIDIVLGERITASELTRLLGDPQLSVCLFACERHT